VIEPHEQYVEAGGGVRLFCRSVGAGTELVVVHGGPGFSMQYLADDLAPLARRYRVLFYYQLWYRPFFADSAALARSKGDLCFGPPAALANKVHAVDRHTVASLGAYDWAAPLRSVNAPALVLYGSGDVIAADSAREWAMALANARLLMLPGVGHFPYLEAPDAFFAAVDTFVDGTAGAPWRPAAPSPRRKTSS
jgi:pimeloyl-ACP methyl ester carboxylesterase